MAAPAIDHAYRYPAPSSLTTEGGRRRLALVTSRERPAGSPLVRGTIRSPKRIADLLLTLAKVLAPSADPIVTAAPEQFRFEGLSACCGAYARLDLLPNAIDGVRGETLSTNVDFNAPVRAALSQLGEQDGLDLDLGGGAEMRDSAVERKVKLPARWIRGFMDVQSVQAAMKPRFEMPGPEFRRFLRDLPRGLSGTRWIRSAGAGLRISETPAKGAVAAGGIHRLRVLEAAAAHVKRCRIYGQTGGASTAWELTTADSRFNLVLSADASHGFFSDRPLLATLARTVREKAINVVRASLRWQRRIDAGTLAEEADLTVTAINWALARCAESGLVGYDLAADGYFHRELPFDLSLFERVR